MFAESYTVYGPDHEPKGSDSCVDPEDPYMDGVGALIFGAATAAVLVGVFSIECSDSLGCVLIPVVGIPLASVAGALSGAYLASAVDGAMSKKCPAPPIPFDWAQRGVRQAGCEGAIERWQKNGKTITAVCDGRTYECARDVHSSKACAVR